VVAKDRHGASSSSCGQRWKSSLHASDISRRSITCNEIESFAQAVLHIARSSIAEQLISSVF
jgi:hypothetical protein